MTILVRHLILLTAMLLVFFLGRSQEQESSKLYQALKEKDSILFDAAFNRCDPETMASLFTQDFEFYHDKVGATMGRDAFLAPMNQRCANWNSKNTQPAKRILIDNSLEVFPLYKSGQLYGAIQHGIHRFEFLNNDNQYQKGDTAKFTHVWVLEEEHWRIKRELSYDHQAPQESESK